MAPKSNPVPQPSPVQLEFAWAPALHRLVHIGEARAGETYLHPDPDLRLPLIPRKGLLRRHHFAHHPGVLLSPAAAEKLAGGGEGLRHLNYKLALAHRLQQGGDLTLRWRCPGCDRREQSSLRALAPFEAAHWEVAFRGLRLDVGLLRQGKPVAALEVRDTHAIDPAKAAHFTAAARDGFCAFEFPVDRLPLRMPLNLDRRFPPALCPACEARRAAWLEWSAHNRPAVNFSGWQELPAGEQSCLRFGGGWATRRADGEALQPVLCWLEIAPRLDREILVTALTVHRRRGRLRWRELRLRAPSGRPTRELDFQLAQAAQEFAAQALRYRQRLARADADQLWRWLAAATPPPPAVAADSSAALPAAAAAAAVAAPGAISAPLETPPPPAPERRAPPRRLAGWFDRLAHQAADWLERDRRD